MPGAIARQAIELGDATGCGKMGGEYFPLGAGADIAPLLRGLTDDGCRAARRPAGGAVFFDELAAVRSVPHDLIRVGLPSGSRTVCAA